MKRLAVIAVAVFLAIPATVAAQTGTDDTKAIQRNADQWMAAYNAGDAAAVANMYLEDALVLGSYGHGGWAAGNRTILEE